MNIFARALYVILGGIYKLFRPRRLGRLNGGYYFFATDAMWYVGPDGKQRTVSTTLCELCGMSKSHINHSGGYIPWGDDPSVTPHPFKQVATPSDTTRSDEEK